MVVEFIVFFLDRLDPVEEGDERVLQCLGVSSRNESAQVPLFLGPDLHCRSRGATTHLCNSSLASLPSAWMSSLVLLGLMALTSSGPTCISTGPTAKESRGTIMVPLLLRLGSFGRTGFGAWMSKDDPDAESDQSGLDALLASPIMNQAADAAE